MKRAGEFLDIVPNKIPSINNEKECQPAIDNIEHVVPMETESELNTDPVDYWREILKRLVSVIKCLSALNWEFKGCNEDRQQNYMCLLNFSKDSDNFLKNHLENYNTDKDIYFSKTTYDEVLNKMVSHVRNTILDEIREAKYFSIIIDSIPNASNHDQLAFILRYVDKEHEVQEKFISFIYMDKFEGGYLQNTIISKLGELSLNIENCYGQTFDNEEHLEGPYKEVQEKIKNLSRNAVLVPWANYPLDLVANAAAECSDKACMFFYNFIKKFFEYFSISSRRWDFFTKININLERICKTRWSVRADAILALKLNFHSIKNALLEIYHNPNDHFIHSPYEIDQFCDSFEDYETVLLLVFWNTLLQAIKATNESLQNKECSIKDCVILFKSLTTFIMEIRNGKEFENMEHEVELLLLTKDKDYKGDESFKKKNLKGGETDSTPALSLREFFIENCLHGICDKIISKIEKRVQFYEDFLPQFEVFLNLELHDTSPTDYENCIKCLISSYGNNINETLFREELAQFLPFAKKRNLKSPIDMYKTIQNDTTSNFPNVVTILKIFLTIPILPVINRSEDWEDVSDWEDLLEGWECPEDFENYENLKYFDESLFSVLRRVKICLECHKGEEEFTDFSILNIEEDMTNNISYDEIMNKLAEDKSKNVTL